MRAARILGLLGLLLAPLAAAHDDNVIYRLRIDSAGPAAGLASFHLASDHDLLGIGVGGCALGSVGVLRIVTPTLALIEVNYAGTACSSAAEGLIGDAHSLPAGDYVGAYALALTGPALIEVYARHS